MDSSVIYKALYQYFLNYEYKLFNTFLYDWESDFFAQSKSGYRVEVEVKVSRGDFFKDFEKPKHKLFKDLQAKRTHSVSPWPYETYEDREARVVCEYNHKEVRFRFGPDTNSSRTDYGMWNTGRKNGKWGYWVNDYGPATVSNREKKVYAQCTNIRIKLITEVLCPNQFYFACPAGLITEKELPAYAGLIFINTDGHSTLVKKAPYLHKNHQDLTKHLLKKYYNLWEYKVEYDKKLEILTQSREE